MWYSGAYLDARPELAYAPSDVLALEGQLGLNPALKVWLSNGTPASWR